MEIAIKEAIKGIHGQEGGPFGAVIVKDGVVLASAHNTVLKENDSTCHAEIKAIRSACAKLKNYDLTGCEIYTTGKPCPMCKSAIKWAKIDKVYYGCDYDDARDIGFDEDGGNNDTYMEEQIDWDLCRNLYEEYKKMNSKKY